MPQIDCQRGLPTAVDLLTLALTAGLNLYAALQRVAAELRFSSPVLAEEFDITRRQAELRRLESDLEKTEAKLANPDFRAKAPFDIVRKLEERATELRASIDRLSA